MVNCLGSRGVRGTRWKTKGAGVGGSNPTVEKNFL